MTGSRSVRSLRSFRALHGALAASLLAGCGTLHVGQSPEQPRPPQPDTQCIADFYLPYAALAADVYRTRGAAIERLQLVVNDDMVRKITNGKDITRDDLTYKTNNKQLAFLQHIYRNLKAGGRAAVVLPDNVLFEAGVGTDVRRDLMNKCNCILRQRILLPEYQ